MLNSHLHFHVLVTEGVFSARGEDEVEFHPAVDLTADDIAAVQRKVRHRGLRWLHRHGHLDDLARHQLDNADHAGGWSVDGSVTLPASDRQGLERLVRYCARPPLSAERLGRLNDQTLVYSLRKPTIDGRTELYLTPLELLDRLSALVTPPRVHKHRYCGVLAPNARLRQAVTATAGPAAATLQLLSEAQQEMGLGEATPDPTSAANPLRRAAARCWALLLARIYECLPLRCPRCSQPMRLIAFIIEPPVIERILTHIGQPTTPPPVLPARSPPQGEMGFGGGGGPGADPFDQDPAPDAWPGMDQTAGASRPDWE